MRIIVSRSLIFGLLFLTLSSCQRKVWHLAYSEPKRVEVNSMSLGGDDQMDSLLLPYRAKYNASMNEVLGEVDKELVKSRTGSALCNWFADAVCEQAEKELGQEIDVFVQNYGGIRLNSIAAGQITRSKIYELMPFENALVMFEMTGQQLVPFLDRVAASGGWAINKGNSFVMVDGKADDIYVSGKPIELTKLYQVALPDYIAHGGDGTEVLSELEGHDTKILIRDLLIRHTKANPDVKYNDELRIRKPN